MEIVIKISDEQLAQSGMDKSALIKEITDRLEGDSYCDFNLPHYGIAIVPRGAIKVPGFILTQWDDCNKVQRYFHSVVEMPQFGHTTVCPYTLEFDLPQGLDAKSAALKSIKTQQAALEMEFANKQKALELRLQEITDKPAD